MGNTKEQTSQRAILFDTETNIAAMDNSTLSTEDLIDTFEDITAEKPLTYWIPCLVILAVASIVGTFGNLTILFLVYTRRKMRKIETIFIVNLAISDLYVTTLADPMSLIGKFNLNVNKVWILVKSWRQNKPFPSQNL